MPTPVFLCGAECGVNAIGTTQPTNTLRHWATFGADVTVAATPAGRSAGSSYKHNPAAGTAAAISHTYATAVGSPATVVARVAVYFEVLPDVIITVCRASNAAATYAGVRFNPTGNVLEGFVNAQATVAGSFAIAVNTWYLIEFKAVFATTRTLDWRVNGAAQTQASEGSLTNTSSTAFAVGDIAAHTGTYYSDDICVSGTSADYPIGDGYVTGLYPSADGTHSFTDNDFCDESANNFAASATTIWQHLKNPLDNAVSGVEVRQRVIRTAGYCEFAFENLTGSPTVNGLAVVSQHYSEGTAGNGSTLNMEDGATEFSPTTGSRDWSETSACFNYRAYAVGQASGVAWTATEVNALLARWGYSGDVTPNPDLGGVMLEVDLVSVAGVALTGYGAAAAAGIATLLLEADLRGRGDAASGGTAAALLEADLRGSGHAASGSTADMLLAADLQGAGHAASGSTANLLLDAYLAGHGDAASVGMAELLLGAALAGSGDSASAGVAELLFDAYLAGYGAAASGATADLTVTSTGEVLLDGYGAAASAGVAEMLLDAYLAGYGAAASGGSADLTVTAAVAAVRRIMSIGKRRATGSRKHGVDRVFPGTE